MKQEKEIDLVKLWQVLKLNQKKIWQTTSVTTIIAIIYCIFATPIFTAKVTINPPKLSDAGMGMNASLGLGALASLGGGDGLLSQKTDADVATALLQTTQLKNMIINRFNLVKYYDKKDIELTRKYLDKKVVFVPDMKSGFLEIDVDDKNPKLAMDMANYYVDALGQVISNSSYNKSNTKQKFFAGEIDSTKKNLSDAQQKLKSFVLKNGIASGMQTGVLSGISMQLQARLVVEEAQLHSMSSYMTTTSPDYIKLQGDIDSIKKQLENVSGQENSANPNSAIPIPANLAPELAIQYTDLMHDVMLDTEVLQILYKQYEAAKIDTLSEIVPTSIQVVDPAVLPLHKSKPKRLRVVLLWFLVGVFLSVIYHVFKNTKAFIVETTKE